MILNFEIIIYLTLTFDVPITSTAVPEFSISFPLFSSPSNV
jgi:hypothetical protein